jgi:hypothetical protein
MASYPRRDLNPFFFEIEQVCFCSPIVNLKIPYQTQPNIDRFPNQSIRLINFHLTRQYCDPT